MLQHYPRIRVASPQRLGRERATAGGDSVEAGNHIVVAALVEQAPPLRAARSAHEARLGPVQACELDVVRQLRAPERVLARGGGCDSLPAQVAGPGKGGVEPGRGEGRVRVAVVEIATLLDPTGPDR